MSSAKKDFYYLQRDLRSERFSSVISSACFQLFLFLEFQSLHDIRRVNSRFDSSWGDQIFVTFIMRWICWGFVAFFWVVKLFNRVCSFLIPHDSLVICCYCSAHSSREYCFHYVHSSIFVIINRLHFINFWLIVSGFEGCHRDYTKELHNRRQYKNERWLKFLIWKVVIFSDMPVDLCC